MLMTINARQDNINENVIATCTKINQPKIGLNFQLKIFKNKKNFYPAVANHEYYDIFHYKSNYNR